MTNRKCLWLHLDGIQAVEHDRVLVAVRFLPLVGALFAVLPFYFFSIQLFQYSFHSTDSPAVQSLTVSRLLS